MHVAEINAPRNFFAEDVHSNRSAGGEICVGRAGRHGDIREENSAGQFNERNDAAIGFKILFQHDRIKSRAVRSVHGLEHHENGNGVYRVFKFAAEKSGAMSFGENPAEARACIEDAVTRRAAVYAVSATRPDFKFVAAVLRACLRECRRATKQRGK